MRFKYPPCSFNPETEKPYTRHKWIIPTTVGFDGRPIPKTRFNEYGELVYHVICERCKIRDPRQERY